jgi:hypothetical protein
MYLSPGSMVGLDFADLNTTGAASPLAVNVTLTATAPVLVQDGVVSSTAYDNGTLVPDRVFQLGLSLSIPTGNALSFSIVAEISVSG